MALLYRMGSGNGGSDLKPYKVTVNVDSEFNGTTVTLYQSGQTDLTATATNGKAIFYPMNSGVWRAKATYATYEYYDTENGVDLSYFGDNYELNISLGNAIITVDWETVFNGATCTLTNGNKTFTHQLGTSGTWVQKVNEDGNWVASAEVQSGTYAGQTFSRNVNVNGSGNYSISIHTIVYQTVTVYGGRNENITLDGTLLCTTSDDKYGKAENISIPQGTHTISGAISGKSYTVTVDSSTTTVLCMPQYSLYWYGNQCEEFELGGSGDAKDNGWTLSASYGTTWVFGSITFDTNKAIINAPNSNSMTIYSSLNKINNGTYRFGKLKSIVNQTSANNCIYMYLYNGKNNNQVTSYGDVLPKTTSITQMDSDISSANSEYYATVYTGQSNTVNLYGLWFEK